MMPRAVACARQFHATIASGHKQNALEVPFDPAQAWDIRAQPIVRGRRGFAVRAQINGTAFDSFVVARSKKFWLLLPVDAQESAGVRCGDEVSVTLRAA